MTNMEIARRRHLWLFALLWLNRLGILAAGIAILLLVLDKFDHHLLVTIILGSFLTFFIGSIGGRYVQEIHDAEVNLKFNQTLRIWNSQLPGQTVFCNDLDPCTMHALKQAFTEQYDPNMASIEKFDIEYGVMSFARKPAEN